MTELATQRADQDGIDVQSELEQLTDELQREQQELKRIKTITRQVHVLCPPPPNYLHNILIILIYFFLCMLYMLTVTDGCLLAGSPLGLTRTHGPHVLLWNIMCAVRALSYHRAGKF